jgi:hypothetical protein
MKIFWGLENRPDWPLSVFKNSLCSSKKSVIQKLQMIELGSFQKLPANSIAFVAKWLRIY